MAILLETAKHFDVELMSNLIDYVGRGKHAGLDCITSNRAPEIQSSYYYYYNYYYYFIIIIIIVIIIF